MTSKKEVPMTPSYSDEELWASYGKAYEEEKASRERRMSFQRARMSQAGIKKGSDVWNQQLSEIQTESEKYLKKLGGGAMAEQLNRSFLAFQQKRKKEKQGYLQGAIPTDEFNILGGRSGGGRGIGHEAYESFTPESPIAAGVSLSTGAQAMAEAMGFSEGYDTSSMSVGRGGIHGGENPFGGGTGKDPRFQGMRFKFDQLVRTHQDVVENLFTKKELVKKGMNWEFKDFIMKSPERKAEIEKKLRTGVVEKLFSNEPATMEEWATREFGRPWSTGQTAAEKSLEKARTAASGSRGAGGEAKPISQTGKGQAKKASPQTGTKTKGEEDKERKRSPWI